MMERIVYRDMGTFSWYKDRVDTTAVEQSDLGPAKMPGRLVLVVIVPSDGCPMIHMWC